jgi:hypothetical protein
MECCLTKAEWQSFGTMYVPHNEKVCKMQISNYDCDFNKETNGIHVMSDNSHELLP